MKSEYLAIFEQRAKQYDKAMQDYPDARDNEFLRLFEHIDSSKYSNVLDVPSGGGYLARYLPHDVHVHCLDPCSQFNPQTPHLTDNIDLDKLNIPENHYDLIVSLAAMHHIHDKQTFIGNCIKALTSNGVLCIGDVMAGSGITEFLDSFAGKYNGTGHSGKYLRPELLHDIAQQLGLELIDCSEKDCPWVFSSEQAMLNFCQSLFGLCVEQQQLKAALAKYIGYREIGNSFQLQWKLLYCTLRKADVST